MSVSAFSRAGLAAALFVLAAAILVAKGGALLSGYDAAYADGALRQAAVAEKGPARDKALDKALTYADEGLAIAPGDPRLWGLRAETLLRRAVDRGISESEALLTASASASRRATAAAPNDAASHAQLALVLALQGDRAAAAAALKRSYELDITSPLIGQRRLEAAGRAWPNLGPEAQRNVLNEACMLAARGDEERARLRRLRMGAADAGLALTLDDVLADGACRGAMG